MIIKYLHSEHFIGTCKIEKKFTSTIKVTFHANGKVSADTCYSHYGHMKELGHTWLPTGKRKEMAAKLQQVNFYMKQYSLFSTNYCKRLSDL